MGSNPRYQSTLECAVVGVCGGYGRGGHLIKSLKDSPPIHVKAVCDVCPDRVEKARKEHGIESGYTDYAEMLDRAGIDCVLIATPMHLHVSQSVAALRRNIHVLCEVTAGVTVEECRELVAACRASKAIYMMAENYNYREDAVVVAEMVRRGEFGEPYYAEGGYVADAKGLAELTPWRRKWQLGISGVTYGSHNLGPILGWMPGERITAVCCSGTGSHYSDKNGEPYADNSATMMCRTTHGRQIIIRSDFVSSGPGSGVYYQLQGTRGAFASPRFGGDSARVWLQSQAGTPAWLDFQECKGSFYPEWYQDAIDEGRADTNLLQIRDFIAAVAHGARNPIDVHTSLDLTLPGLVSQLSILKGGVWMDVPDSREW